MNEFEAFFYYGGRVIVFLIGLALSSTFFFNIPDVETWRTILLIVFVLGIFFIILTSKMKQSRIKIKEEGE
ncbi:unnamed protein product [marine sediment metagenome]|uniref:Uncharacterized protein n=1 Tax=marine sediment metagenome TaxID=412755 RepID=X1EVE2_9ZZZZ